MDKLTNITEIEFKSRLVRMLINTTIVLFIILLIALLFKRSLIKVEEKIDSLPKIDGPKKHISPSPPALPTFAKNEGAFIKYYKNSEEKTVKTQFVTIDSNNFSKVIEEEPITSNISSPLIDNKSKKNNIYDVQTKKTKKEENKKRINYLNEEVDYTNYLKQLENKEIIPLPVFFEKEGYSKYLEHTHTNFVPNIFPKEIKLGNDYSSIEFKDILEKYRALEAFTCEDEILDGKITVIKNILLEIIVALSEEEMKDIRIDMTNSNLVALMKHK